MVVLALSFNFQFYRIVLLEFLYRGVLCPICDFIDRKVMLFLIKDFGE